MDDNLEGSESVVNTTAQRRRRTSFFSSRSNGSAVKDNDNLFTEPSAPPQGSRPRRLATWADETNADLQQLRNIQSMDFTSKGNKQKLMDSSDNDVTPMIPDIEEVNEYEMTQQVAEPPTAHNQIISFQDLDENLMKHSGFTSLDGIDLTSLTHFCLPENQVKEPDIPWTWDNLMSDITSKLMSDNQSEDIKM